MHDDNAFKIIEYQSLREEIIAHIDAIRAIETETLLGMGAFSAWLFSAMGGMDLGWKLGGTIFMLVFVMGNLARVRDRERRIQRLGAFTKELERHFSTTDLAIRLFKFTYRAPSYETFLDAISERESAIHRRALRRKKYQRYSNISISKYSLFSLKKILIKRISFINRRFLKNDDMYIRFYNRRLWSFLILGTIVIGFLLVLFDAAETGTLPKSVSEGLK